MTFLEAFDAINQPFIEMQTSVVVPRTLTWDVAHDDQLPADRRDRVVVVTGSYQAQALGFWPTALGYDFPVMDDGTIQSFEHLVAAQRHLTRAQIIKRRSFFWSCRSAC